METPVLFRSRFIAIALMAVLSGTAQLLIGAPTAVAASTWNPTALVNTESFQTIDEGDGTTDIEIRFGGTLNERIYWDRTNGRFDFTDDVHVEGNLTGSGTLAIESNVRTKADLTINSDDGGVDAILTFGNNGGAETLRFSDSTERFEFSDDMHATGNITGSGTLSIDGAVQFKSTVKIGGITYTFPTGGQSNGYVLTTDGNGTLTWEADDTGTNGLNTNDADVRYVNIAGDTMTGALIIGNNAGLTASGAIQTESNLTINKDNVGADAILTFGNNGGAETLRFSDSTERFEFSDDMHATGNIAGSGTLAITGNAKFNSTLTINGLTYTFPSGGQSNGYVLTTDGNGTLTWSDIPNGSGGIVSLHPEYAGALYYQSGSTYIGQLSASGALSAGYENTYEWTTSRSSIQDYWIATRVRVPDNFSSWDPVAPIQFRYKTKSATNSVNHVKVKLLDTAGVERANSGMLANTSFTTATVTGPEAAGTYTPGGFVTVLVKLATTSSGKANAGYINLNWETTTP